MTTEDAWTYIIAWRTALSIATSAPVVAGLWHAIGSKREDDAIVSEANDVVLDALSDADTVRTVQLLTDRDLRDQLTVEEAMELHADSEQRKWGIGWN